MSYVNRSQNFAGARHPWHPFYLGPCYLYKSVLPGATVLVMLQRLNIATLLSIDEILNVATLCPRTCHIAWVKTLSTFYTVKDDKRQNDRDDKRQNDKTTKRQNDSDDRRQNDKTTVTLFLRAPLVAIGAQKLH